MEKFKIYGKIEKCGKQIFEQKKLNFSKKFLHSSAKSLFLLKSDDGIKKAEGI
jgi:hypothetical protein